MRKASDFLMALQLTGAAKRDSLASLQVRLPAIVIGGGLTGIDTTTEAAAYYPVQVEKFLERWETLAAERATRRCSPSYDAEEAEIAREFLAHGRAVRAERARAAAAGEKPDFSNAGGGVGRRVAGLPQGDGGQPGLPAEPRGDHRVLRGGRALHREAVAAGLRPRRARRAGGRRSSRPRTGEKVTLPARTLFVAAGTAPNVTYERERPGSFEIDPRTKGFQAFRAVHAATTAALRLEPATGDEVGFFTSYLRDGRTVTFYGDNNPGYAGSVVRAMASAKDGAPHVEALFAADIAALDPAAQPARDAAWRAFAGEAGRRAGGRRWRGSSG